MSQERVLMVSTYPPRRCGVGTYARQAVEALERHGADVAVLSPPDCSGRFRAPLRGFLNPLRILRHAGGRDRVIVQYSHPEFYYGTKPRKLLNVLTSLSFLLVFVVLGHRLEVVIHEPPHFPNRWHRRIVARLTWSCVPRVFFHSQREKLLLEDHLGFRFRDQQWALVDHAGDLRPFTDASREVARRRLGLDRSATLFLCIGFLQASKGFDRVARIFGDRGGPMAELYIVGCVRRDDDEEAKGHRDELAALADRSASIHLIESFVSDEDFDLWITAADHVVLPYRSISSSGVLARTALLKRPALVSDVGGLRDQMKPGDCIFTTDEELRRLVHELADRSRIAARS